MTTKIFRFDIAHAFVANTCQYLCFYVRCQEVKWQKTFFLDEVVQCIMQLIHHRNQEEALLKFNENSLRHHPNQRI